MIKRCLTSNALPTGLCYAAAMVQAFGPLWLVLALVAPAVVLFWFGLARVNAEWADMQEAIVLQDTWRRQRDRWR